MKTKQQQQQLCKVADMVVKDVKFVLARLIHEPLHKSFICFDRELKSCLIISLLLS